MPPQQRTILIVDDDHEILESMRTVLENKGFRILAARDGNAGLMLAERESPDLIVLDMMMPKKSGFLVLEKLKSRPGGLILKRYVRVLKQLGTPVPDDLPFKELLASAEADTTVDPFDAIEMIGVPGGTATEPTQPAPSGSPAPSSAPTTPGLGASR